MFTKLTGFKVTDCHINQVMLFQGRSSLKNETTIETTYDHGKVWVVKKVSNLELTSILKKTNTPTYQ